MKEATGELNMTVITVIAIVAVGTLFTTVVWPMVKRNIVQRTCDSYSTDGKIKYIATKGTPKVNCIGATDNSNKTNNNDSNTTESWYCCPDISAPN